MIEPNVPQASNSVNTRQGASTTVNDRQRTAMNGNERQSSPIEDVLAEAMDRLSIPYERQYRIFNRAYDFAVPSAQLLIECDGHANHSSPEDRDRDSRRDREAEMLGWLVWHYPGSQINSRPMSCAAEIKVMCDMRIQMLNLIVSRELCGEYAWPSVVMN